MSYLELHAKEAGKCGGHAIDHASMSKLRADYGNFAEASDYHAQARAFARLAATHAFICRRDLRDCELEAA